jgi:hypothetical protein
MPHRDEGNSDDRENSMGDDANNDGVGEGDHSVRAHTPAIGLVRLRMVIRYPVTNVDLSESKYRYTGKIFARDLGLLVSRLYRLAVTRPQSHVVVTLSPSLGADLLCCINNTRDKERK